MDMHESKEKVAKRLMTDRSIDSILVCKLVSFSASG